MQPASAEEALPAMVTLGDGSVLPLQDWKLSYEYAVAARADASLPRAPLRRDARDLWIGKRVIPLAGTTLEVQYVEEMRERDVDGEARRIRVSVARSVSVKGADGKVKSFRLEPPHADLLAPGSAGVVQPRALDFLGQSITGTRRSFCLFGYSTLVECLPEAAQQVIRIEFPR
jgi:hypothetical protein